MVKNVIFVFKNGLTFSLLYIKGYHFFPVKNLLFIIKSAE